MARCNLPFNEGESARERCSSGLCVAGDEEVIHLEKPLRRRPNQPTPSLGVYELRVFPPIANRQSLIGLCLVGVVPVPTSLATGHRNRLGEELHSTEARG